MPTLTMSELQAALPSLQTAGTVDLDMTSVISGALFVLLLIILRGWLFKPYLAILDKREALTEGAADEAEGLQARAAALSADADRQLDAAQAEAAAIRESFRRDAKAHEEQLVSAARSDAAKALEKSRATLGGVRARAEAELEANAQSLSQDIVRRFVVDA
jgi:F-type H+-transporting ATPase subunit b